MSWSLLRFSLICTFFQFFAVASQQLIVCGLKSDFEVFVLRVWRDFFDFGFPDIFAKFFFYVPDAIVDCLSRTLGKHLNGTIRQVADKAS